jgi:hypothetical protein
MFARLAALVAALGLLAPPVWAQDSKDLPYEGTRQREEGEYSGVTPGKPRTTEGGKPLKRPRDGTLAWVGFVGNGTDTLFLQAPTEFTYEQRIEGNLLIVRLDGIKRLARNVRRPLETRYFDTSVARVKVVKVGKRKARKGRPARKAGVEVQIRFKNKADLREAIARTATEADGYFYLYLEFPEGSAPASQPE